MEQETKPDLKVQDTQKERCEQLRIKINKIENLLVAETEIGYGLIVNTYSIDDETFYERKQINLDSQKRLEKNKSELVALLRKCGGTVEIKPQPLNNSQTIISTSSVRRKGSEALAKKQ